MADADRSLAPGRSCGGCTLCCKLLRIDELKKPQWQWCAHCAIDSGCTIYEARPADCKTYVCGYLKSAIVPEAWYPRTSHMVIGDGTDDPFVKIYVDPDFPDVWRQEPFYSDLKDTAREALDHRIGVIVHVAKTQIVIFPDRDVDFGQVGDDEEIIFHFVSSPPDKTVRASAYKQKRVPVRAQPGRA